MTIEAIGEAHRVPVKRDECGDKIIPGKNGHLYMDGKRICVCYTDDGRTKPLTKLQKTYALRKFGDTLIRIQQNAECEFIAQIKPEGIATALFRVLRVRRFMVTKGVPKPVPEAFVKQQSTAAERRTKGKFSNADASDGESGNHDSDKGDL